MNESFVGTTVSRFPFAETMRRLLDAIETRGAKVFAVIDHSGEAAVAGLAMRPTKVIIFGSPRAGTPLMLAVPEIALDLPMKLLVREDADALVLLSYNTADFYVARHGVQPEMKNVLEAAAVVAASVATSAT